MGKGVRMWDGFMWSGEWIFWTWYWAFESIKEKYFMAS
jgi:hypothetical protein